MKARWIGLTVAGLLAALATMLLIGHCTARSAANAREAVYREAVAAGAAVRTVDADGNWAIKWIGGAK